MQLSLSEKPLVVGKGVVSKVEAAIEEIEKRPFDLYVLGPFLVWYGLRSKGMPKLARRIIVTSGIFQVWYAWRDYRELPEAIASRIKDPLNESTNS